MLHVEFINEAWAFVDSYEAGISYQDYILSKAAYFTYHHDPQLYLADVKQVNGFGHGSSAEAWRRLMYAKLYAEYALNQRLALETLLDSEALMEALTDAQCSDDPDYLLWALLTFGAAIGGVEFGGGDFGDEDDEYTKHGRYRQRQRGVNVDDVIQNADITYIQGTDGSDVFIKKAKRNRYDIVIRSEGGRIVTVMKNKTRGELKNLARVHEWE